MNTVTDAPDWKNAMRLLGKINSRLGERDAPDWKVGLHILAKIHNRLAELSGSPYRVRADIEDDGWHWRFEEVKGAHMSKFWQFIVAAVLGTAIGLTLGHLVFG